MKTRSIAVGFLALLSTLTLHAHHVIDGKYDVSRIVTIRGTVARIALQNPHINVYIDSGDANGAVVQWNVETFSPANLSEDIHSVNLQAIAKNMFLRVGDAVVADVFISKTGMNEAANRRWTLADGRVIEEGQTHKVNGVLESF